MIYLRKEHRPIIRVLAPLSHANAQTHAHSLSWTQSVCSTPTTQILLFNFYSDEKGWLLWMRVWRDERDVRSVTRTRAHTERKESLITLRSYRLLDYSQQGSVFMCRVFSLDLLLLVLLIMMNRESWIIIHHSSSSQKETPIEERRVSFWVFVFFVRGVFCALWWF